MYIGTNNFLVRGIKLYIINYIIYVSLCVGGLKGKAGIHLKYYPGNRDTFEMYPAWESYVHNWWINL